ncbi:hypothetical protein [Brucella intermedia]|uniref:hypothetical protein n=1 Tax=Brucella intermedia TaxID=94625 RepID=UPI00165CFEE6|nr:hypothetical protein [Brucella intermedia]QNQ40964.1 hypothetical protein IAR37_03810 [Brucella intermedia]
MANTANYNWPLPSPSGIQMNEVAKIATSFTAIDTKIKAFETSFSNHKHKFADLEGKPTTLGGYGITDGMTAEEVAQAIKKAVDDLVNGSGSALDTLKELADALGNDSEFATTVGNALGVRVRVDAAQTFTLAEKKRGRDNIDAVGTVDKGKPDGVASLDSTGKVPTAQLPAVTTTATVGAAMAGANAKATPDDGDLFGGVLVGVSTMFKITWANIKAALATIFVSKAGDTLTGSLGGVSVSGGRSSFWGNAEGGGYAQMWTRGAPFYSSVSLTGSSYAPVIAEKYGNPGWGGIWSAGVLNYSNGAAAGFAIHHLNSSGNENVAFEFRADGTLRLPGAVYKGTATAAYGDGGTYWMHITGNAGYAASAGNANTVGGWSQGTIADQDNWRVTDTRFAGYVEHAMERDTGWHAPSGYVFTYAYRKGGDQYYFGARQPQIYIPNAGWRALGGW